MSKTKHFFLKLSQESFQGDNFPQIFTQNLNLPVHLFPPIFSIEENNFFCGGYFVCYNQKVNTEKIASNCQHHQWQTIADLIGDFLIIFCDFFSKEIFILTSQTGTFPCYFSFPDDNLILSTDFGLVKGSLKQKTLNLDAIFDYLAGTDVLLTTEKTVLSEIHQIPPGALLRIKSENGKLSFNLTSLVNVDRFLNKKVISYSLPEKFADDLVLLLSQLISERLKALGDLSFVADLSSGFDSPLICYLLKKLTSQPFSCYSCESSYTLQDTDPSIVKEFAKKHNLRVNFFQIDELYPFSDFDLKWTTRTFYPGSHAVESIFKINQMVKKQGGVAIFQGYGGDEIYGSFLIEEELRFPIQYVYFKTAIDAVGHYHFDRLLTNEGVKFLFNRDRFMKKNYYPLIASLSAVSVGFPYFSVWWETGVWPINPFIDSRLIQFARRIPCQGRKKPEKQDFWRHREDIFVPSQFRPKGHPTNLVKRFITEKRNFVISTLKNSLLGVKGLVKAQEIIADFSEGKVEKYLEDGVSMYLHNLVRLEYFLQQNKVKIPNY